jgi:hypothetical protein
MLGCVTFYFMRTRTAYSRPDMHMRAQRGSVKKGAAPIRRPRG